MKVLLHAHTSASKCSGISARSFIAACQKQQYDVVAVTDHNTIASALEIQKKAPFKVIVGEEISTADGEIIGLFLTEPIPRDLSAQETIQAIKKQGGLVYLPHPFDTTRRPHKRLNIDHVLPVIDLVDIVEVANARNLFSSADQRAKDFAQLHQKITAVGADSHFASEMKQTFVEIDEFSTPEKFLISLKNAQLHFRRSFPHVHVLTVAAKILHRIGLLK